MAANDVPCCESMFWVYLVVCVALVSFAGLMSGLTLGLMSLSQVELEVLAKAGEPQDRKNAEKILPIVKNQHLLLCTLLIGNALAMEALPVFIDSLLSEWASILISVTLILAFGEIIPQAVCSRHGLGVGAKLSVLVRLIVIVLFPIAYPISKLLDLLLGKRHTAIFRRAELKTLVSMHGNEAGKGGELTHDETTIISGALDMTQKTAKDAMTPISKIFSLNINSRLDEKTMELIEREGRSRVPIYSSEPTNIIGFILVKSLIKLRPEDETPIRDLAIRRMPRVHESLSLYDILNKFQTGQSHMAAVMRAKEDAQNISDIERIKPEVFRVKVDTEANEGQQYTIGSYIQNRDFLDENGEVIGIITLEDIMEELIQEEILDETDTYVEVHERVKINMLPPRRSPGSPPPASHLSSAPSSPYRLGALSSNNNTPVFRSPLISPYLQSAVLGPALYASPSSFSPISPTTSPRCGARRSQSPRGPVSRKSYEKLTKPDGP